MSGDYWIIDVDAHITEPPDVWTSRVAARYRDRVPHVERIDGRDLWLLDGETIAVVGATATAGFREPMPATPQIYEDTLAAASDPDARLRYLDDVGIYAQLLYPNVGGFGGQRFLKLGDRELMYECVRAYNDFQIDWCSSDAQRLIPVVSLPFWDVDDCVREIERCATLGFKTLLFTGEPHRFGLPYLGEPHWEPLWDAAVAHHMPVNFHVGSGEFTWDLERMASRGFAESFALEGLGLFHKNGQQVCDLLLSGVLPRHPELRVVSVESGMGWLPFALEAVDYQFLEGGGARTRPEFDRLPSRYLADQVYVTFWFEQFAPQQLLDRVIPADRVLFETDFPHPTCLYGNVHEQIERSLHGVDEHIRTQVLWDNAVELYHLDVPTRSRPPSAIDTAPTAVAH